MVNNEEDVIAALHADNSELARMAERARQRTLDEHSGERRARQLISYFEQTGAIRTRQNSMEVAS